MFFLFVFSFTKKNTHKVEKRGFVIKVAKLDLGGIVFPRSEIQLSFRGISLPPRGSIVETNTPFGESDSSEERRQCGQSVRYETPLILYDNT